MAPYRVGIQVDGFGYDRLLEIKNDSANIFVQWLSKGTLLNMSPKSSIHRNNLNPENERFVTQADRARSPKHTLICNYYAESNPLGPHSFGALGGRLMHAMRKWRRAEKLTVSIDCHAVGRCILYDPTTILLWRVYLIVRVAVSIYVHDKSSTGGNSMIGFVSRNKRGVLYERASRRMSVCWATQTVGTR